MEGVFGLDVESVDVVQRAVVSFRHDRVSIKAARKDVRARATLVLHQPGQIAVAHHSDTVSIGNQDGAVREAGLLNAATEKLLLGLSFTGKLTVIIQNGRILKSGYEEGYFRQRGT